MDGAGGVCDDHYTGVISLPCCGALVFCRHPDKNAISPSPQAFDLSDLSADSQPAPAPALQRPVLCQALGYPPRKPLSQTGPAFQILGICRCHANKASKTVPKKKGKKEMSYICRVSTETTQLVIFFLQGQ